MENKRQTLPRSFYGGPARSAAPAPQPTVPMPSLVITQEVIDFAKRIQTYQKRQSCGSNGCGMYYMIPSQYVDQIAQQIIKKDEDKKTDEKGSSAESQPNNAANEGGNS